MTNNMNKVLLVFLVAVVAVVIISFSIFSWALGTYNNLIKQDQIVSGSWATVETQYQRRFDLIPSLVGSTKGMLKQEQTVFQAIADARTKYAGAASSGTTEQKVAATNQMESALSRLLVVMENYPTLKSDQTIRGLMDELAGTENRIQVSRDRYNEQVRVWNTKIKVIPTNLIAGLFGFNTKAFFESTEDAYKAVPVDLSI